MEKLIELLQQNWELFKKGDKEFLQRLDKNQLIELLIKFQSYNIRPICYYCLNIGNYFYRNNIICDNCIENLNLIKIHNEYEILDELDLKKKIIMLDERMRMSSNNWYKSVRDFPPNIINQEWYHHCFGRNRYLSYSRGNNLIFDLQNELHHKFFMICTRFNHYKRLRDFDDNVFYYKSYQNESSVEMIMAIIDTARMIFRQFLIPKCLRNLIIEWYFQN